MSVPRTLFSAFLGGAESPSKLRVKENKKNLADQESGSLICPGFPHVVTSQPSSREMAVLRPISKLTVWA